MNRRLAALGAGLLGLAALVALATRAKTPTGGRGATHAIDGQTIVGYTALAIMGLAVVGVPVLAYAFWTERSTGREWLMWFRTNFKLNCRAKPTAVSRSLGS